MKYTYENHKVDFKIAEIKKVLYVYMHFIGTYTCTYMYWKWFNTVRMKETINLGYINRNQSIWGRQEKRRKWESREERERDREWKREPLRANTAGVGSGKVESDGW
jgi:hypothetical protein